MTSSSLSNNWPRRWPRKIFSFHKIVNALLPPYLQSYLNRCNDGEHQTRSACKDKMTTFSGRTKAFNLSFYLRNGVQLVKKFET